MLSQLPTPAPGAIENFLGTAAAVAAMFLLFRKAIPRRQAPEPFVTETKLNAELNIARDKLDSRFDKMDARFLTLTEKVEQLGTSIHTRLTTLDAAVARLDERTKT